MHGKRRACQIPLGAGLGKGATDDLEVKHPEPLANVAYQSLRSPPRVHDSLALPLHTS